MSPPSPKRRRWPQVLAVLAAVLVPVYWWLFLESHVPEGSWAIDLAEVRRLASSLPGDKPSAIRVEQVTAFHFPKIAVVAGERWSPAELAVFSYQLVFPERTGVVDTALDEKGAEGNTFDGAAYQRVSRALGRADFIVVTHEHFDHLGGLAAQPDLAKLLPHARLTKEQVAHPELLKPAELPRGALEGYAPLDYDRLHALAPGVVSIKAPGHTPGSQLVYVQRADGAEYLLLGDVAWHRQNVDEVRERARLVTAFFLGEDRAQVLLELAELNRLTKAEPQLHLVPGHDRPVVEALVAARLLERGFIEQVAAPAGQ